MTCKVWMGALGDKDAESKHKKGRSCDLPW